MTGTEGAAAATAGGLTPETDAAIGALTAAFDKLIAANTEVQAVTAEKRSELTPARERAQ